ncbi:formyltransferase family protein [Pseudonocardia acidicola]|uniref:Methionyl-tRNA formyltransferase n=1 Tax=Pseudonocardia acidicola TaxID=2724939 RepID=A0ABX1SN51_9PSEU|nr:methionyl-tRNA formyltransferase [Pseudonocardia acidicola]
MSNVRSLRPVVGRVVFIGAVHEARPALDALLASPVARVVLVVTAPDAGAGPAARRSGAVDLATPARAAGAEVLRAADVNAPHVVGAIRETDPDLLVVVGWTRLIGGPLLAVPRRGCVGFHASLLPEHRGRAPVNWAILRGETLTGNTMMMLDPGADTGDIVDQRAVSIGPDDTCATLYERVALAGVDMLTYHLPALLAGTAPRCPQAPDEGDVLPKRTPEMGVIDWSRPAAALHDWVRALTLPYPGAFTTVTGRRVMVWRSRPPVANGAAPTPPGTVLGLHADAVHVSTGDGHLVVTQMSDPGEPPQSAADWCRAAGVGAGTRFDAVAPEVSRWALGFGPRPAEVRS